MRPGGRCGSSTGGVDRCAIGRTVSLSFEVGIGVWVLDMLIPGGCYAQAHSSANTLDTDAEMRMLFPPAAMRHRPVVVLCRLLAVLRASPHRSNTSVFPTNCLYAPLRDPPRVSRTSAWQLVSGLIRSSVREPPVVSAEEPCQVQTSPRLTASAAGMLISRFRGGNPLLSAQ